MSLFSKNVYDKNVFKMIQLFNFFTVLSFCKHKSFRGINHKSSLLKVQKTIRPSP